MQILAPSAAQTPIGKLAVEAREDERIDYDPIWSDLFSNENIKRVFFEKLRYRSGPGVDRVSVSSFERTINSEASIISRKCIHGTYQFTPYLEQLVLKGKGAAPRILSIPTIRDKIVLSLMKDYMHTTFGDYVPRDLPNTVVFKVKKQLSSCKNGKIIRLDIKNFYDTIDHEKLLNKIRPECNLRPFLRLLGRAITNPTLPPHYSASLRKSAKSHKGVPQGLPISNILAEIYIAEFDLAVRKQCQLYQRFVDDILIFSAKGSARVLWRTINKNLTDLSLEMNEEKSTKKWRTTPFSDGLEFLGYRFSTDGVSVKTKSYQRFLASLLAKVTRFKAEYPDAKAEDRERRKNAFIHNLNERITGAIDGRRRYGWIFFYSEITDLGLLHQIDRVLSEALSRVGWLEPADRKLVKKVVRAFYEAKHSPESGYIHNYNSYSTIYDKLNYLIFTGRLKDDPGASYADEQIDNWFRDAKAVSLLKLERDLAMFS
jgi:RNA-directed DNA polymerase